MGMINVTKQGPEAFADNERIDDLDFTTGLREFKPPYQPKVDYRAIVAYGAVGCISFLVLWVVYGVWKTIHCWGNRNYNTCTNLNLIEPWIFAAVFSLTVALIVANITVRIVAYYNQTRAIANRSNLVLDRFGDQQPADLFSRVSPEQILQFITTRYEIANNLERDIAPHKLYRSVNSLSLNNTNHNATPMLELNADSETLAPIPSDEWLTWINKQPHVILAGATGKGKTVTAKPIIAPRIAAGEQLIIIDPHADYWFGLDVIGGGENWEEIRAAIQQITMEYQTRQQARETYRRVHSASMPVQLFKRLTVVMDEGFLVSLHTNTAPRGQISTWDQFIEVLSSGARKINMSVVMLSQTANVEDLGISGPLRENFTRIAVDNRAIKLMIKQEESDASRRQLLYDALIGMQYPAVTVVDTSVVLLDRTGLDQIPDPSVTPANNYPFVRSSGSVQNGHNGGLQSDGRNGHSMIDRLRVLRMSGVSREEARDDLGLVFSNEDWTLAQ